MFLSYDIVLGPRLDFMNNHPIGRLEHLVATLSRIANVAAAVNCLQRGSSVVNMVKLIRT